MAELDLPERDGGESTDGEPTDDREDGGADAEESAGGTVQLGGDRRLSVPADASAEEAAALAAAVTTHLEREESAASEDREPELDRWKLAGRLGARRRGRLPRERPRGGAWKAVARCW